MIEKQIYDIKIMKKITTIATFFVLLFACLLPLDAAAYTGGDVNNDGEVNIADVNAVINVILGGSNIQSADVNYDGEVNIADVNVIINIILGGTAPTPPGVVQTYTVNGVTFKMVKVDGGTFTMGASEDDTEASTSERPAHQVTVSSFSIGETEVTQELWVALMGSTHNPSHFTGDLKRPVDQVSWNQCQEFIAKLNQLTGKTFRLPTEAEWEFAARGGNKSKGYLYAGSNDINEVAWWGYDYGGTCVTYGTCPSPTSWDSMIWQEMYMNGARTGTTGITIAILPR